MNVATPHMRSDTVYTFDYVILDWENWYKNEGKQIENEPIQKCVLH